MVNFIALRDARSLKFVYIGKIYVLNLFSNYYNIPWSGGDSMSSTNHHPVQNQTWSSSLYTGTKLPRNSLKLFQHVLNIYEKAYPKYLSLQAFRRSAVPWIIQNLWIGDVRKYHERHHFWWLRVLSATPFNETLHVLANRQKSKRILVEGPELPCVLFPGQSRAALCKLLYHEVVELTIWHDFLQRQGIFRYDTDDCEAKASHSKVSEELVAGITWSLLTCNEKYCPTSVKHTCSLKPWHFIGPLQDCSSECNDRIFCQCAVLYIRGRVRSKIPESMEAAISRNQTEVTGPLGSGQSFSEVFFVDIRSGLSPTLN